MKKNKFLAIVISILGLASCNQPAKQNNSVGESVAIYHNGDIITMEGSEPTYTEAVVEQEGKIIFVGTKQEALEKFESSAKLIDLKGQTLLPAFIDAHGHYISALSVASQVNVYPAPNGPGNSPEEIVNAIKTFVNDNHIPEGKIIQAYGYDENVMPGELLNRDHLDAAFPKNPVIVGHVSMHGAVLNSEALKLYKIDSNYETPPGGVVVRKEGTNEPYGLIMETAYLPVFSSLPKPTLEQEGPMTTAGQMMYAQSGITLAHEGATHVEELNIIKRATDAGANIIDVVVYPFMTDLDKITENFPVETWGTYNNRLKIGGVKITSDGSPQGKTAYFSTPYLTGGPGGEENWIGEPTIPQNILEGLMKKVYDWGVPLIIHTNGDGAIDMFLEAYEKIRNGDFSKPWNVTTIHTQFLRKDQIPKFVEYGIRPSFYTEHTFYFADAHIKNRGQKQAAYLSPMRDAIDAGLHPTNHTDFYVAPLDQLFMMWTAVNRISRKEEVLGADQRITPYEALKSQTIWAAEQYDEQDRRGTLTKGKIADFVILDKNPLKVDPVAIKDIKVVETIKEGTSIYKRN